MAAQETDVQEFLDRKNVIAVVGVSDDPAKYGNKVFFDLLNAGYKVVAVHRDGGTLEGRPRCRQLADLPDVPDVVNTVVPPAVTEQIVEQCTELGIDKVWMQPGSENPKAIDFCRANKIKVLHGACIMIEKSKSQA